MRYEKGRNLNGKVRVWRESHAGEMGGKVKEGAKGETLMKAGMGDKFVRDEATVVVRG